MNIVIGLVIGLGLPAVCGYIAYKSKEHDFLEIIDKIIEAIETLREAEELADEKGIGILDEKYEIIFDKILKALKNKIDRQLTKKEKKLIDERLGNKGYLKRGNKNE